MTNSQSDAGDENLEVPPFDREYYAVICRIIVSDSLAVCSQIDLRHQIVR